MLKFSSLRHFSRNSLNVRTITILRNRNGKPFNETICSATKIDFINPNSPVLFHEITKTNFKDYKFPIIKISYDQNDVVEHAISVGVEPGEKYSDLYLNKWNTQLQVLPTFIFPFTNKIFLDMSLTNQSGILLFDQTVHGEHYVEQIRRLPPKGDIHLEIKTLDVLDKGKGTLYILSMNGFDNNGEAYFKTEYQMFEIGTGGFNGNKSNPSLTRTAEPDANSAPDSTLQFSAIVPEGGYKAKLSDSDLTTISIYSPLHPRQHYSDQYDFMPCPLAHGRYTFGKVIKMILFKYGHGHAERFKAAKVRFAEPVYLGENVQITTWKTDSRILFRGNVHRDGKSAKVLTGGYIDLES